MLARRAFSQGGVPTTPVTASVIGAIQAQEVMKFLHDLPALFGRGFVYEGASHGSYAVAYPIHPDCPWHEGAPPVETREDWGSDTPLETVWARAEERLGGCDAIEFGRELVESLECPACGERREMLRPVEIVGDEEALCPSCGADCVPRFIHSLSRGSEHLRRTPRQLGLPAWEIVWARRGERFEGFELAADAPASSGGR